VTSPVGSFDIIQYVHVAVLFSIYMKSSLIVTFHVILVCGSALMLLSAPQAALMLYVPEAVLYSRMLL
jgi:hypothetical protein